jgi:hypothetical protein
VFVVLRILFGGVAVFARCRMAAIMAKASKTSETWRCQPCQERVSLWSRPNFTRLDVLLRVQSGRLCIADACALIGLRRRQVFHLLRGLKEDCAAKKSSSV